MEQLLSTQSPSPKQKSAWLRRLAAETRLLAESSENFDFVVAHAHEYSDGDLHVARARGRVYNRLQGLLSWYKSGERLDLSDAPLEVT